MTDSPTSAGAPKTGGRTRTYEGDGVTVEWRAARCIHTANCLSALPTVFDTSARPWIDVDGADPEQVVAAVRTCPTGALRYSGPGLAPDDGSEERVTIEAQPGGPLFIRGRVCLTDHDDVELATEPRLALCRCGRSDNKPYCDNSHQLD